MARKTIEIEMNSREPGKSVARGLRTQMRTPGVVYGPKHGSVAVEVDERDVMKYKQSSYENAILKIKSGIKEINNVPVLMKEVALNPVTRKPTHVDFLAFDAAEKIHVDLEIFTEGTPKGAAEGGVLQVPHRHIQVECLPTNIPEHFTIDVSGMDIDDTIHVSDINLPEGVVALSAPTTTLVTLHLPRGGTVSETTDTAEPTDPAKVPAAAEKAKD